VQASGGIWGGCIYDVDAIVAQLSNGTASPQFETSKDTN
jgi:hypothetical protein